MLFHFFFLGPGPANKIQFFFHTFVHLRLDSRIEPMFSDCSIRFNLACTYSKDSNQFAHLHSLINFLGFRLTIFWTIGHSCSVHLRLIRLRKCVQSDLSLRWAHMQTCRGWVVTNAA